MNTSTLTAKGQTTVPKKVREALDVKPGDKLVWTLRDGEAVVRAKNKSIRELAGILHRPGMPGRSAADVSDGIAKAAAAGAVTGLQGTKP